MSSDIWHFKCCELSTKRLKIFLNGLAALLLLLHEAEIPDLCWDRRKQVLVQDESQRFGLKGFLKHWAALMPLLVRLQIEIANRYGRTRPSVSCSTEVGKSEVAEIVVQLCNRRKPWSLRRMGLLNVLVVVVYLHSPWRVRPQASDGSVRCRSGTQPHSATLRSVRLSAQEAKAQKSQRDCLDTLLQKATWKSLKTLLGYTVMLAEIDVNLMVKSQPMSLYKGEWVV